MGSRQLVSSLFGSSDLVRRSGLVDSVKPSQLGQTWSTRRVSSVNSVKRLDV
ncbi:hypothetical protein Hanom_Chr11g01018271 [Helianthus anomalus]